MSILSKYSRTPTLYTSLPSKNNFYNLEEEDKSIIQEVGVMPLTTLNTLSLKNPEKLFNGSAIEEVIRDCTTLKSIQPRDLLKCDVDYLLFAIRIATSGATVAHGLTCPSCKEETHTSINIDSILGKSTTHESSYSVKVEVGTAEDRTTPVFVNVYLRPNTYGEYLRLENESFKNTKNINQIQNTLVSLTDEDRDDFTEEEGNHFLGKINEVLATLAADTMAILAESIIRVDIVINDEVVDSVEDKVEIGGWLKGLSSTNYEIIRDKLHEINDVGVNKVINVECQHCEHTWETSYEINLSDFFDGDS